MCVGGTDPTRSVHRTVLTVTPVQMAVLGLPACPPSGLPFATLSGELPSEVMQAWSELEAPYGTGLSTGILGPSRLWRPPVASGVPALDETFSGLDLREGNPASLSAEQLMELSLSPCPERTVENLIDASFVLRARRCHRIQRLPVDAGAEALASQQQPVLQPQPWLMERTNTFCTSKNKCV